eukprot:SAG11_NODE_1255_length_5375_cov_2.966641_5_plen_46_part_00
MMWPHQVGEQQIEWTVDESDWDDQHIDNETGWFNPLTYKDGARLR